MSDIEKSELIEGSIERDLRVEPIEGEELDALVRTALFTLLWSSGEEFNDEGEYLFMWDQRFTPEDATDDLREKVKYALDTFLKANAEDLTLYINHPAIKAHVAKFDGEAIDQIAHDWILSRGGHGTGFWDRGTGEIGRRLHTACEHNETSLFVGEDAVEPLNVTWAGKFHGEGW